MIGSIFKKFYQDEVNAYDFKLRADVSHIPLNYAKLVLANNVIGLIYLDHYANGKMVYWAELRNGNDVKIEVKFSKAVSYQREYERDDMDVIDKHTIIYEIKGDKKNKFYFDSSTKRVEGKIISEDEKVYFVM